MRKLRIRIDRARRVRYLAGTLVALIGATCLLPPPAPTSATALGGYLALLVAALLFAYRNFIEIDTDAHHLAHRIGLLFPFPWTGVRFDTGKIRRVTLGEVLVHTEDDDGNPQTKKTFGIRINGATGKVLCTHSDYWAIRHAAERISRALGVELQTSLFGDSNLRAPADIDVPLAERWRRAGTLKEAPRQDGSTRVIVQHSGDSSLLSVPAQPGPRLIAAIGLALALGVLYAVAFFPDVPAWPVYGFGALWVCVFAFLILQHTGRNKLRFTATAVEFRYGLAPIRQRMDIDDIEELLDSGREMALLGDRAYIVFDQPDEPEDRAILRQFVERQIAQRQARSTRPSAPQR